MRTRSKSCPNNSNAIIPRRRNRTRVPNIVKLEIRTIEEVVPMADRTMKELLQAPTKGYEEAIIILEILAKNFEIKTNLLQLVQTNKFHGFERDNPYTHISNFKRMTSTLKYRDVPNDAIKLMLFPYSLDGAARIWGLAYEGPLIPTNSSLEKVVERETEETTDKEQPNCQGTKVPLKNCSAMLLKKLPEKLGDPAKSDFILEEIKDFLKDESIPMRIEDSCYDPEGDILYLEELLNDDPSQFPPMDLKQVEETKAKSSIEEPPELELKELLSHLEYAFLEETDKLLVIIAKDLKDDEKEALLKVLKSHKRAIA
nr:reverse transcriptase domain-containing protein [Tanacetum cinerariifolium]